MSKVMIVEDDENLRQIYSIRLTAEGYTVVSAADGEEALAMAVNEKPDLILSDVMMPKISGFDMLDILRSSPETANVKVIMMTALSSDDQRERGEKLGADRYLVKSQVGIEDVVNVVKEVLSENSSDAAPAAADPAVAAPATAAPQPVATPVAPAAAPIQPAVPAQPVQPAQPVAPAPSPAQQPVAPVQPLPPAQPAVPAQPAMPAQPTAPVQPPVQPAPVQPAPAPTTPYPQPATPAAPENPTTPAV